MKFIKFIMACCFTLVFLNITMISLSAFSDSEKDNLLYEKLKVLIPVGAGKYICEDSMDSLTQVGQDVYKSFPCDGDYCDFRVNVGAMCANTSTDDYTVKEYAQSIRRYISDNAKPEAENQYYETLKSGSSDGGSSGGGSSGGGSSKPNGEGICENQKVKDFMSNMFMLILIVGGVAVVIFTVTDFLKIFTLTEFTAAPKFIGNLIKRLLVFVSLLLLPVILNVLFGIVNTADPNVDISTCINE
ncbi:MAG: hypothetical protein ACK5HL_02370 [Bacilli bacterium]